VTVLRGTDVPLLLERSVGFASRDDVLRFLDTGRPVPLAELRRALADKQGPYRSPTLREMIRAGELPCAMGLPGCARVAVEPSHFPSTGANGGRRAINDGECCASCRSCHDAWHRGAVPASEMALAVSATRNLLARRYPEKWRAILRELANGA